LQCFFVVENFTANAVSVAIGDNRNRMNFNIIMDAVEDYARRWIKREVDQDPELESLSDWVRTIRSYKHDIVESLVRRNNNIFVMKRGKTLNSLLVFKYTLRSTINKILSL
jgi:bisphosphoglycerate-dependent phosphoglycerate mutase